VISPANLNGARKLTLVRKVIHSNYARRSQFDIGIIQFEENISSSNILCLPKPESQLETGAKITIYGYGLDESGRLKYPQHLQSGVMDYIPHPKCGYIKSRFNSENLFCVGKSDEDSETAICKGDSGGAAVYKEADGRNLLTGIISSGHCGRSNLPGVNVRVSMFTQWIQDIIISNVDE
jgi:hypothetical protein